MESQGRPRTEAGSVNPWQQADWLDADRLTDKETMETFRAGLWGTHASRKAMYALAKRWHFFDPLLADEASLWRRRCFMDLLILSGMWHPGAAETLFAAQTQPVSPGWIGRMFERVRAITIKPVEAETRKDDS